MEKELHLNIKQWAEADRPREKLERTGKQALSDTELVAILLRSGSQKETAVQLAQRLLSHYQNDLHQLSKLGIKDFRKFNGIGKVKALSLIAALELGKRGMESAVREQTIIRTSFEAFSFIKNKFNDLQHEEFYIITLNRANKIIGEKMIAKGGISSTVVDVRLVIRQAVEHLASGLIISHNHPSGNLQPSDADLSLTRKIQEAAKWFDMNLLDHLIIGNGNYYSFADDGKI